MKWLSLLAIFSTAAFSKGELVELHPNAYIKNGQCVVTTNKRDVRGKLTLHREAKDVQSFKVMRKIILNDHKDKHEVYAYISGYEIEYDDFRSNQKDINAKDVELWINGQVVKEDDDGVGQPTNQVSMNMKEGWVESNFKANTTIRNYAELEIDCDRNTITKMEVCDLVYSFYPYLPNEDWKYKQQRQWLLNTGYDGRTRIFKEAHSGYWCPDTYEPDTDSPF